MTVTVQRTTRRNRFALLALGLLLAVSVLGNVGQAVHVSEVQAIALSNKAAAEENAAIANHNFEMSEYHARMAEALQEALEEASPALVDL